MLELRWIPCKAETGAVQLHYQTWAKLQWRQQRQVEKPTPFGLLLLTSVEWSDWQDVRLEAPQEKR